MRPTTAGVLVVGVSCAALLYFSADAGSQEIGTPLPRTVKAPAENPTTPAKVTLGRMLFWDPVLSGPRDVACATCHHPRFGYAENRDLSIGVTGVGLGHRRRFAAEGGIPLVKRNSPTVLNVAFNGSDLDGAYDPTAAPMFWDVRARSLETQALEPLKALEEMRGRTYPEEKAVETVVARLEAIAEYRRLFTAAFGADRAVTAANVGRALAAFQRTLTATNAPFDRYMRGDANAMSAAQVRGMGRFERIGCVRCHNGPMFSDYKLHVLGVPDNPALPASDAGAGDRGTGDRYAFRTASLRNLAFTAPYMHSGIFQTLEDVLDFYDDVDSRGGRRGRRNDDRNPNVSREELDPLVRQLRGVDDDDEDLLAFLEEALSDPDFDRTIPPRVPSGLAVGGRIE
jgi:cytochrome c peroxidase